ncbi:MAG: nuclear transport factor 2 family protein [Steroidobacteraceae bacterium]
MKAKRARRRHSKPASKPAAKSATRPVAKAAAKPAAKRRAAVAAGSVAALRAELGVLRRRVQQLEDVEAIKKLQRIYGYYVDKAQWSKVVGLFSADCEIEIAGRGVYTGMAGARTVFFEIGRMIGQPWGTDGLGEGQLHNHIQLQGVVNVARDGRTARGRWRALIQVGVLGKFAHWAEGPYEMEYVKQGGKWLIRVLRWFPTFYTPYEEGWGRKGLPMSAMSTENPPDRPPTYQYQAYPGTFLPPYHFPHPVTGED